MAVRNPRNARLNLRRTNEIKPWFDASLLPGGTTVVGAHSLLSPTHSDTSPDAATRGSLITGNATPEWDELVIGGIAGSILTRDAADVLWSAYALAGTAGQTYTFPPASAALVGGTGVANRVAYWTGVNAIGSDAGLTVDTAGNGYVVASGGYVGITSDVRMSFDSVSGSIIAQLDDNVGADKFRVVDDLATTVFSVDSNGEIDTALGAGYVQSDAGGVLSVTATAVATPHAILSATHSDTTAAAVVRGDVMTGQGVAATWTRLAISVPAATFRNYLGAANGDTEPGYKALFDATVPTTIAAGAAAATGSAVVAARRDHTHGAPATYPATAHNLLSATHGDTTTDAVTRGSLIYGNSTPAWDELVLGGASGSFLTRNATDVLWSGFYFAGTAGQTYTFPTAGGTLPTVPGTLTAATVNGITAGGVITHAITNTSDGAANHSTILSSSAAGALTMDDYFTIDGGTFGISGNELLTVNAAGTWDFSGIAGVTVEDADWIGNGAATARLVFDSSGARDIAQFSDCYVGIGQAPTYALDVLSADLVLARFLRTAASNPSIVLGNVTTGDLLSIGVRNGGQAYVNMLGAAPTFGVGITTATAKLHVDQSAAAGAIPALTLDQGDASEQHIVLSMNGADQDFPNILQLDVTGSPALWWDESENAFGFKSVSGLLVEDADWIGNSGTTARLGFDSSGATDYAYFSGCAVGVGTTTPTTTNGGVDIASGGLGLIIGAQNGAITRTNLTAKYGRIGGYHYTNAEEPITIAFSYSDNASNIVYFGGGDGTMNAATSLRFYTAANTTTTTGTLRLTVGTDAAFTNIGGITVQDADYIGNSSTTARLVFDSSGATNYAFFRDCNTGWDNSAFVFWENAAGTAYSGNIQYSASDDLIIRNSEASEQIQLKIVTTDTTVVTATWGEAVGVANMSHLVLGGGADGAKFSLAGASETYFQVPGAGGGSNIAYIYGTPTTLTQDEAAGADAVLVLNQEDDSEEMINFTVNGTGAGYPVDTATAVGTAYARLRVAVNGTFKYIQLYNA